MLGFHFDGLVQHCSISKRNGDTAVLYWAVDLFFNGQYTCIHYLQYIVSMTVAPQVITKTHFISLHWCWSFLTTHGFFKYITKSAKARKIIILARNCTDWWPLDLNSRPYQGPPLLTCINFNPSSISNHIYFGNAYPFPNFNGGAVINFISHFIMHVITYSS